MALLRSLAGLALALSPGVALAHVTLDPAQAPAGGYQVLRFTVGHGCGDTAATTALRVEIDPAFSAARPQPKPGWMVTIDKDADGKVTAVSWRGGPLAPDQFDQFGLLVHAPDTPGPIAFPVVQSCEGGAESQWTEVPEPDGGRPTHPAPILTITPAATSAAHQH